MFSKYSVQLSRIKLYINSWRKKGYEYDIPDEADPVLESYNYVPSYKLICQSILKNDTYLSCLGFQKPKSIYYDRLKNIELRKKNKLKAYDSVQINMWDNI